jgi:hypothetical protein
MSATTGDEFLQLMQDDLISSKFELLEQSGAGCLHGTVKNKDDAFLVGYIVARDPLAWSMLLEAVEAYQDTTKKEGT